MDAFTIKDLENLSGIKAHTIRIWEQRYSFLRPQRTGTNIRYYNNQELRTLLNVALLNKYGFKISHIDKMNDEEIRSKILSLQHSQAQYERIVNELIEHMVDLDLDGFEDTLDGFISSKGIEKTISNIIFPFLEKIGILWLTNHINPAQEHLVTNIIRQKLIVGIETTGSHLISNSTVLLFLPEGEHHELGLLFIHYLLKNRGVKVYYMGSSLPVSDLEYVVNLKKPDYIYTHLTSVAHNFNLEKLINNLKQRLPNVELVVSGRLTQSYKRKLPPGVQFRQSLGEVHEFIATI